MAYEPIEGLEIQPDTKEPRDRRRVFGALAVLALIIVLVLILLLLPRCSGDDDGRGDSGRGKRIVAVPDTPAEPGIVSVWISEDLTIEEVLADAGLAGSASDLGGGRYVVDVEPGTERASVRRLREVSGVYDAGFVFPREPEKAAE